MCCDCDVNNTNQPEVEGTYSALSLGAGQPIYAGDIIAGNNTEFTFRSLIAGTGVSFVSTPVALTISAAGVTTLVQLGNGSQVGSSIFGVSLILRTLVGTGAVNLTQATNTITINSAAPTSLSNLGGGFALGTSLAANTLTLRTLLAGTNISIVQAANTLTINNTAVPTNTVTNLGSGQPVLVDVTAGSVRARSLVSAGSIDVNNLGNEIQINAPVNVSTGTGVTVYTGLSGNNAQFKSIIQGQNMQVTEDGLSITLDSLIRPMIQYSGRVQMNTYPLGNPEITNFIGFGQAVQATCIDAFPADFVTLPDNFIGFVTPRAGTIKKVKVFMRAAANTTVTETVNVYAMITRTRGDPNTQVLWFDTVQSYAGNITAGDYVQRSFDIGVDYDIEWELYFSLFCHRPDALGEQTQLDMTCACVVECITI